MSEYQPEFEMTGGRSRTANDTCIVSCGIGPHYQEPLHSTRLHCEINAPEAWRLFYRELPIGCPPHAEQMYAFKIWSMQRAIEAGFRYVIWIDSAFQPIASIEPLLDVVRKAGWYCPPQTSARLGEYCSDTMLEYFAMSRAEAWTVQLVFSGLLALDMRSFLGQTIWNRWRLSQPVWNGAHYNEPGQSMSVFGQKTKGHVSNDPGVSGHRHDEAALSAILHQETLMPEDRGFLTLESPDGFIGHHVKLVVPGAKCR